MTTYEKVTYWIALSDEDLKVSGTMLDNKHYLYVGFMCHQCVEKIFKACFQKLMSKDPPYMHDLQLLAKQSGFWDALSEEQQQFVRTLGPLNIKTRYPDYKRTLARELTDAVCADILRQTKELTQWTKENILSPK
ncbi:MAG: HEPN domain-containing protein [Tannerella sp.]|nr:HEPN domain-containing protein [Tannerella sp.]